MLLNANISNMPFRKAIKLRIWVSVILILVGIKSMLLVLLNQVGSLKSLTSSFGISLVNLDSMRGFYTGFGIALIAVGMGTILKNVLLLRNLDKYKKAEIEYSDERIRFITNTTFSVTSYVFFIALSSAVVISGMFNAIVFVTLLCTFVLYMLILLIVFAMTKVKH